MTPRLVLADDHVLVREGLRTLLERHGFEIVGQAANGREAVRLARTLNATVVIMDISMPILNGIDATRELARWCDHAKSIVLTQHDEDQYVAEALRAGVRGYVLKRQAATDLIVAIQEVSNGRVYLSPGVSGAIAGAIAANGSPPQSPLTGRERQVLQLIAEGQSSRQVATVLGISAKTAESHRARLMQKLDIHETATLVRYAIRLGLIDP
jgi:DNA-binding NarL/FixJ family response regulator